MKLSKISAILLAVAAVSPLAAQNNYENHFTKPLGKALDEVAARFGVRFKYNVDTTGLVLPYADFRVRPYSIDETLQNMLGPFDFKAWQQSEKVYKIKPYEYPRRYDSDGYKMIAYLTSLYNDKGSWEQRRDSLRRDVRKLLTIDELLAERVPSKPHFSKVRKFDGYTVQNFYLETTPGMYVAGSIYAPTSKGKHPLIICPNGHFYNGRYNKEQQQRLGTLARMGAICVDYDLYGWGESELQVGAEGHHTSRAHVQQILNGISILDFMIDRKDVDKTRVGVNGGSGGGTQTVLLSFLDPRYTAACPTVSLASHFDGGCPCESGMPIQLAAGGTCNPEMAAAFAPKPMRIISDGKDWTHTVPDLEFPYLQRVYGFYDAKQNVSNTHLPKEGHDFGVNKRNAVYDFFIETFGLDRTKLDESKVTIETAGALKSFGPDGSLLPANAIRFIPAATSTSK